MSETDQGRIEDWRGVLLLIHEGRLFFKNDQGDGNTLPCSGRVANHEGGTLKKLLCDIGLATRSDELDCRDYSSTDLVYEEVVSGQEVWHHVMFYLKKKVSPEEFENLSSVGNWKSLDEILDGLEGTDPLLMGLQFLSVVPVLG